MQMNQKMKEKICKYYASMSIFSKKCIASYSYFSKRLAIYQCKFLLCKKLTCKNQTWFPLIDQDHATLNELKQRYNLILIVIMHYARTHCPKMKMNEEKMSQYFIWSKKNYKKICFSSDLRDNPIYFFWESHGWT